MMPPMVADMDIAAPVVHFLRAQGVEISPLVRKGGAISLKPAAGRLH